MPKRHYSHTYGWCKRAGKKIMADRIQAALVLEDIQLKSRRTHHNEVRFYQCHFGNHFHLTSEEQRTEVRHRSHSA